MPSPHVDYDHRQCHVYHEGRQQLRDTAAMWQGLLRRHAGRPHPTSWIDVGAGTGRYSRQLAALFDAEVSAVEPSAGMRAQARARTDDARIRYLDGFAEALPVADASHDAALMSMVTHHLRDRPRSVRELARVLRSGGRVLLRCPLRDHHLASDFYRFFRAAYRIDEGRLPGLAELQREFEQGGFILRHHELVSQRTDDSLADFRSRMSGRPFSTFDLMSDDEIATGFAALDRAVAAEISPEPVFEEVDLLVYERPGEDPTRGTSNP